MYRDVADLQAQCVPINGEAGVGYRIGAGYALPPLMFIEREAAPAASLPLAQAWLDQAMAASAEEPEPGTETRGATAVLPPSHEGGRKSSADSYLQKLRYFPCELSI